MPKFTVVQDEMNRRAKFYIDEKEVGSTDYDTHGWSGMEDMQDLFEETANTIGAELFIKDAGDWRDEHPEHFS